MTNEQGLVCVVLVDPNTSLVRRLSVDARQAFLRRGATDVPKADIVFDYTHLEPQAKIEAAQFAWSPPEGATEVRQPSGGPGGEASALVGQPAPEFSLVDMQGNTVTLSAQKGSVVVLDFWATWCGPCVQSLPALDQISRDMAPSGVKVFAVNVGEDKEQVQGFLNSRKIGLTTLLDADNAVGDAYKAAGIPQTVIIDKAGVVQKVFVGSGHEDEIRQQIEKALAS
jgi:peroxiredoxin